ncbi:NAD(P)-dependent oxidoreductase [Acinetobacter bohemicus]|uniref:NAD(P)-dependent oxidoreductase n=1 Tax=Acinetobacter bohemicus TaxID=1435036 RepID=UPI000551BED7|nr:NAD(P)-dependent oxidoreductase [Acinetobacter bohemicus]
MFEPSGTARTQLKDINTAMAYAQTLGLNLPVAKLVDQLFESMVNAGEWRFRSLRSNLRIKTIK